jgi:hypothetical protein
MKLNENELKVLTLLAESFENEQNCYYFRGISSHTGLDIKTTRRICRSLARDGLAECLHGLFNDDGEVAGSGYCATQQGYNFIFNID